ncbi:N-acetylmuramoyl-L-alanine amidase [Nitrincola tapanii]|uniref:N-acetylmuramoyl-L-alanine amidase n=1 Tax=Nitrincola tapanii TaxID=1708751 RepID=UPI002E1667E8
MSLLLLALPAWADIVGARTWLAPDNTRLVFDLSGPVKHKLFTLPNPDRIVLDIEKASLKTTLNGLQVDNSPIQGIRHSNNNGTLRVVLDLRDPLTPSSFTLPPNDQYGHRLVVDLPTPQRLATPPAQAQAQASMPSDERPANAANAQAANSSGSSTPVVASASAPTQTPAPAKNNAAPAGLRDIIIAIDPGHGGEDPGAIGPTKTREKDIVLAIGRELKRIIDAEQGYRAVMIRDGDYFISLRDRTAKARRANADLFVSIHADGWTSPSARGASVWVLSERGASSEMGRWLASRENQSDLIGGVGSVSLEDKDAVLASVLLDMSMTASRTGSRDVASVIHKNIGQFARMHKPDVEMAAFQVLRSPDMPSILVETGFITNPQEEAQLKSRDYQVKMAQAIHRGITSYFWQRPPDKTWVAWRKSQGQVLAGVDRTHRVQPGDTLSIIAVRNGVSVAALRQANRLNGDQIRVGQVLRIPAS